SVNIEDPDASQDNTNPSMMYLKEDDKNNINEAYVEKRRKVVEENETPENPLQGPRFHKPTIGKDVSKYSIAKDLQQIKANISIAQLAAENPKYLRKLKSSNESDESTEYEDEQLEERIYTLNLWQEMKKENLKQMCPYCYTKTNEE
ncbi:10979_t:CDS:2, partial [Racocetra fulgida]